MSASPEVCAITRFRARLIEQRHQVYVKIEKLSPTDNTGTALRLWDEFNVLTRQIEATQRMRNPLTEQGTLFPLSLIVTVVLVLSLFAGNAQAQDHRFVNRWLVAETSLSIAARTYDAVKTCQSVNRGGHEDWIPSQNCKVLATSITIGVPLQLAAQYLSHRREHHRLERVIGYASLGNVAGQIYSAKAGAR